MNRAKKALDVLRNKQLKAVQDNSQKLEPVEPIADPNQEDLDEWDRWDPLAEDYHSAKNTLALDVDRDPISTITGQVRPISSRIGTVTICDHYAKYGNCIDGEYCERIHISPKQRDKIWTLQNKFELNKNRVCLNYTDLSLTDLRPDPSALLLASVTNARSPSLFYFVAPYESMNIAQYTERELEFLIERVSSASSVRSKLRSCHEQLASLFNHSYRIDNLQDDIYLSQIVACKLQDNTFRRAMVLDVPNLSIDAFNYKLLLIDVGIEVELPRESIYDIKAHCLSEPPMAIGCRLNVKPVGDSEWSQEALEMFEIEARGEKFWLCKVLNHLKHDDIFTVDLYHPKTRASLTERLVESGVAERCLY